MTDKTQNAKTQAATKLADKLRELANFAERAGQGDAKATAMLASYVDGYWHALVVGRDEVAVLYNEESD